MPTGTSVPRRANSVLVGFKDVLCFVVQILIDRSLKDVPKLLSGCQAYTELQSDVLSRSTFALE